MASNIPYIMITEGGIMGTPMGWKYTRAYRFPDRCARCRAYPAGKTIVISGEFKIKRGFMRTT